MKHLYFFVAISLALASCQRQPLVERSFYYWRTTFDLSQGEQDAIKYNGVSRLYVRYFDIDFQQQKGIFPRAPIRFQTKPDVDIVPVLFIKNEVFMQGDVVDLATKCLKLIGDINRSAGISNDEIQLDCDWTVQTREAYFKFVETVKALSGRKVSATIRLHQVKYPETTGIPKVDRGVLMYYNMSAVGTPDRNSIYDRKTALRYIKSLKDYPLPLDVALPIYGWGVLRRDGKPIGLKRKEDLTGIDQNPHFEHSGNQFLVTKNHYFHATYYQQGDRIVIESVSKQDLVEMAEDLSDAMRNKPGTIIFYDLDDFNLRRYEKDIFGQTARNF